MLSPKYARIIHVFQLIFLIGNILILCGRIPKKTHIESANDNLILTIIADTHMLSVLLYLSNSQVWERVLAQCVQFMCFNMQWYAVESSIVAQQCVCGHSPT